jgi:integrase
MDTRRSRRSYGTGALFEKADKAGRVSYYGQWWQDDRQIKRVIGPKRVTGSRDGLTKSQAEKELQRLMAEVKPAPRAPAHVMTIDEAGKRYIVYLDKTKRRKLSTRTAVESVLRVHLVPFFGERGLATVTRQDVIDLQAKMEREGVGPKSIRNYIGTLSAIYKYAMNPARKWANSNPCEGIELPEVPADVDIHFLQLEQVQALIDHARPGAYEALDRAMYRTAAMTGMREGELIALRWLDDWTASKIRVRRSHVLGEFGTPKSKRSSRGVPMAIQVARELELYYQASGEPAEHLLVFPDPHTGGPLDKAGILRRYRRALKAAKLDTSHRFHDLRHTFGTQMAKAGTPMRTLQEWMGHRDIKTTERYVDYAPGTDDANLVAAAFGPDRSGLRLATQQSAAPSSAEAEPERDVRTEPH